ncbi:glycosyltransferase family 4 protein [Henriciella sp. AS95]|uniref:glycosyltransferase family 4 protein n=1 Tax=Henriciella sp. AS95 TaxID=3135782 RepID=UPI0031735AF9
MRILVVNVFYAPQMIGGATRVVADNVRDFHKDRRVQDVSVFCSLQGGTIEHMMRSYSTPEGPVYAVTATQDPNVDFLLDDEKMRARIDAVLDQVQPDIIHFHCVQRLTSGIALVARDRAIPYVITMHDGWWISDRQFLVNEAGDIETYDYRDPDKTEAVFGSDAVKRQQALWQALDGAARILTVSETFQQVIEQHAGLKGVIAIPNGSRPMRALKKKPSEKLMIGYLAGIAHYKGYHQMRAAFMRGNHDQIKLIVVDHALRQNESYAEYWGATEVERIGFIPQAEVAKLYQRLNAVIVPSIWPESFGLVAREALQSGCWLIASNRGAAAEDVIEGKNGHVFDPGQAQDFDRVLAKLSREYEKYSNPPERPEIRTTQEQADQLLTLYEEVLGAQ